MADLTRWDPGRRVMSLRDAMDRLFEDSFIGSTRWPLAGEDASMDIDIYETDDEVVVKAAMPGVKPEDIDINLQGDLLTIHGKMEHEQDVKDENYHRRERRRGTISRTMQLPRAVDSSKAEAVCENGVLRLTLPKSEEAKPRRIQVKGNGQQRGKTVEGSAAETSRK